MLPARVCHVGIKMKTIKRATKPRLVGPANARLLYVHPCCKAKSVGASGRLHTNALPSWCDRTSQRNRAMWNASCQYEQLRCT